MTLRDRLLRAGLQARIVAATAVLVLICGGFFAYRAIDAIGDAYRWNGESEAEAVAHSFVRSLSPRELDDIGRIRARLARLSGAHPQLTAVAASEARPDTPRVADYDREGGAAVLRFPILDGRGRPIAVLRLDFSLEERAEALAAGRREVLLAGIGAGLLLIIGAGVLCRLLLARPIDRISRNALLVVSGKPGAALGWRRRDEIGVLARAIDALGGMTQALQARIDGLALQDPLTGVLNHRGLHDALHEALDHAADHRQKVAVVVLDIDNFEQLNDAVGHGAGDEALRMAARVILSELRPGDICGRIGGDEFLLALPDAGPEAASAVAERIRREVEAIPLAHRGQVVPLTVSIGVASLPHDGTTLQALVEAADRAAYRAKARGRNRIALLASLDDVVTTPAAEAR
jgi:diguanylate cyclase (GGDEF)-like protein